jgi:DNA-binding transcriptional ArsR family regulator
LLKAYKRALRDYNLACALLGQALLDEGYLRGSPVTVFYASKQISESLWKVGERWGLVNGFRSKRGYNHTKWGFSVKAIRLKDIYRTVGPLPDRRKDKELQQAAFRSMKKAYHQNPRGRTRHRLLIYLSHTPRTRADCVTHLGLSYSTVRKHMSSLLRENLICIKGRNANAFGKARNKAYLYFVKEL